ncbi:hypothetical protein T02_16183 [Trichinella nativa]|uniref:Uncharacterized protein n=1 Tax=Trichinella nativa TaxID=6335 RepID=A0A0V1KMU4_9BILA|nr:hypothetical protein T02_16183 [Trichinella nativa]
MALPSIGPEICVVSFITEIHNHVDKYVITKHYYQLVPLSLVTYGKICITMQYYVVIGSV